MDLFLKFLAVLAIVLGFIPLSDYVLPFETAEFFPHQTISCIVGALVFGGFAAMRGVLIGWIGVLLSIINIIIILLNALLSASMYQ